jgi:hypothetical protein
MSRNKWKTVNLPAVTCCQIDAVVSSGLTSLASRDQFVMAAVAILLLAHEAPAVGGPLQIMAAEAQRYRSQDKPYSATEDHP